MALRSRQTSCLLSHRLCQAQAALHGMVKWMHALNAQRELVKQPFAVGLSLPVQCCSDRAFRPSWHPMLSHQMSSDMVITAEAAAQDMHACVLMDACSRPQSMKAPRSYCALWQACITNLPGTWKYRQSTSEVHAVLLQYFLPPQSTLLMEVDIQTMVMVQMYGYTLRCQSLCSWLRVVYSGPLPTAHVKSYVIQVTCRWADLSQRLWNRQA